MKRVSKFQTKSEPKTNIENSDNFGTSVIGKYFIEGISIEFCENNIRSDVEGVYSKMSNLL